MHGFVPARGGPAAALAGLLLSACATAPAIPDEATDNPFVIERDLQGETVATGEFKAINGVRRAFTAKLNGTFDGRTFTLVEEFEFADGERDKKTWVLERISDGRYVGTREDVVGQAVGFQDGNAFRLEYDIRLPKKDGTPGRKVRFRDVMVEAGEGVVINRATVGWLGLRVATVDLRIAREN